MENFLMTSRLENEFIGIRMAKQNKRRMEIFEKCYHGLLDMIKSAQEGHKILGDKLRHLSTREINGYRRVPNRFQSVKDLKQERDKYIDEFSLKFSHYKDYLHNNFGIKNKKHFDAKKVKTSISQLSLFNLEYWLTDPFIKNKNSMLKPWEIIKLSKISEIRIILKSCNELTSKQLKEIETYLHSEIMKLYRDPTKIAKCVGKIIKAKQTLEQSEENSGNYNNYINGNNNTVANGSSIIGENYGKKR